MLEELKNLKYHGGKEGLLYFLSDVIGINNIRIQDVEIICSHAIGKRYLSAKDLIDYCLAFGWIKVESEKISISPPLASFVHDKKKLNEALITSTVERLFVDNIINTDMFSYDVAKCSYLFKNELLPLSLSNIRNTLISQGFIRSDRDNSGAKFYISPDYDMLIAKHCKAKHKQLSLEKLKKTIENNELAGEKAELFVFSFERKRIGLPLCQNIKRISEVDVSAGYDIVSFNSCHSQKPDRFIEVKAVSSSGFYWSRNEYEIARLKGELYYLYLVDLSRVNEPGYVPEIIQNPVVNVMRTDRWFVEIQSYYIKRIQIE